MIILIIKIALLMCFRFGQAALRLGIVRSRFVKPSPARRMMLPIHKKKRIRSKSRFNKILEIIYWAQKFLFSAGLTQLSP